MSNLIIAESFKRFFEINSSKSKIANILLEDIYTTTDFANYIARRGDMVSFLPAGKEHITNEDSGDWRRENRQTAKAGKLARKLITEDGYTTNDLKDVDFELFSNLIKADTVNDEDCQVSFKVVKGEDIKFRYHEDNHSTKYSLGTLADSCMRYDSCQSYFNIYIANPDKVSMLVMVDNEDKTVGRAIVWETNKGTFMDRVYGTDAHQKMFEHYAENKGWSYKEKHSNDVDGKIIGIEDEDYPSFVVTLSCYEYDDYPYMDTLCYMDDSGRLSNDSRYIGKQLRETSGGPADHRIWDDYNEEYIDEDDSIYIEGVGNVHQNSCTYDEYRSEYYLDRDCQRLKDDSYCHEDDAIKVEGYGWHHKDHMDDFRNIDGEWYHEDACVVDEESDDDILLSDAVELKRGGYTHSSNNVICLDEDYYGYMMYALTDECDKCTYSDTWFFKEDLTTTYSGVIVAYCNIDKLSQEEVVPTPNQLTLELI